MSIEGTSCDGAGQPVQPAGTWAGQDARTRGAREARVARVRLLTFDEPCSYLLGRTATLEGFFAGRVDPALYRTLMDHGFRRSGQFFYRPRCRDCNQCEPLRVPVASFARSRSQRRCWRHNQDLTVQVGAPEFTPEKFSLYQQYLVAKHAAESEKDMGAVFDFLYNRVVDTLEFTYRLPGGRLVAVGICDVFADALSSVYCFYDVQERRRGLGTFTALREIDYARERGLGYYYLGFLVRNCPAMCYKASYRPYEVLSAAHGWVAGDLPQTEPGLEPDRSVQSGVRQVSTEQG